VETTGYDDKHPPAGTAVPTCAHRNPGRQSDENESARGPRTSPLHRQARALELTLPLADRAPAKYERANAEANETRERDAIMARLEDTIVLLETERATLGLPNARRPL
jgi:hypothetical protein